MKFSLARIVVASFFVAVASVPGGTISYKAVPASQSDAGSGITEDNFYTSAVDGGNTSGRDRAIGGISFDPLIGKDDSVTANDCTVNALSGTLSNGSGNAKVQADGVFKEIISDMLTVQGAGDNSQQEIVLGTSNFEKGKTYELRIYVRNSSGQNRQVNLAFVGDDQGSVETGFFNEDDATTSPGQFSDRNQAYYISFRYTWDGETTPGVTITQKSGTAPFCLYAVTNQIAENEETAAGNDGGKNPAFALVDLNRLFKEYRKTKDAEELINANKASAKEEYDSRAAKYRDELATVESLSGTERDNEIAKIKEMERSINEWRTSREKELADQATRLREKITGEITSRIKQVAGSSANLIFDSSGNSLNGLPFVVSHATGADITNQMISAVNGNESTDVKPIQDFRIGMVNMNDSFKRLDETKKAESAINAAKSAAKNEYDHRADAYKKLLAEYNSSSGEEHNRQLAKLKEMEKSINGFRVEREKQLQDQALQSRTKIVAEMTNAIDAAVSKNEPTLIFDNSGMTMNGTPGILIAAAIPDLSDQLVSAVNQGRKKGRKAELSSSADLRFASIDLARVFSASPETKDAESEIKRLREDAKDELSSSDATKRQAKENELQETARRKREPIVKKITATLLTLSNEAGFNVVIDSSGKSLNGTPFLIATHDLPDLTDDVIGKLR